MFPASATIPATQQAIRVKRGVRHMRLRQAIGEFLEHLEGNRKAATTIDAYEADLDLLHAHVVHDAEDTVLALTSDRIRAFLHRQSAKGYALATLNRRRSAVASFCQWGHSRHYWTHNPMASVERLPRNRKLPRPYSKPERDRIMALVLPPQEHVLRALMFYTGLRVTPICSIRAQDIEMNDGLWRIRTIGKGSKEHSMPVLPELQEALRGYTFRGPYLFSTANGRPWNRRAAERLTKRWGVAAEVKPCTPHRFRHTLATMLLERGVPITQISKLLGHADISTTMIYAEVSSQSLDDAMMTLSKGPANPA